MLLYNGEDKEKG